MFFCSPKYSKSISDFGLSRQLFAHCVRENGSPPAYRYPIHLYRSTIQSVSRERLGVTRSPLGQPGRYRRYLSFTSVQSYVDITRSPSGSRDSVVSCDSPHKCSFQGFRGPAQWRARRAAVADCRLRTAPSASLLPRPLSVCSSSRIEMFYRCVGFVTGVQTPDFTYGKPSTLFTGVR